MAKMLVILFRLETSYQEQFSEETDAIIYPGYVCNALQLKYMHTNTNLDE